MWSEARIVRQRLAEGRKTDAILQQTVILSVLSKKGGSRLKELLKELDDGY